MFTLLYVLARRRRPVRLLKCPDRASLPRPGGLRRASRQPTAGAGTGFRRLSGRRHITPSGDWASGNPTFALSCGSPGTPSHTPGHVLPVFWHAIFPYCPFGLRSAIRSRDISSHPCPLSGRYNSAPHGAPTTTGPPPHSWPSADDEPAHLPDWRPGREGNHERFPRSPHHRSTS